MRQASGIPGKTEGLPQLLADVEAYAATNHGPNFSLTLEHLAMDAAAVTRGTAATSYWDNELYGRTFDALYNGRIDRRFLAALDHSRFVDFPSEVPTQYLSNHDHSHVTWQAGARDNAGLERWPGLRSGDIWPSPWEDWQSQFNPEGAGVDEARQLVIFHRWGTTPEGKLENFVIGLNFSDQPQSVSVPFPLDGTWTDLLSDFLGSWQPIVTNNRLDFVVGGNWGHVFFHSK